MKKPLAAAALLAATVATLAVPAGAATPKSDWTRILVPCRTGHKAAVIGYSPTHPYYVADPNNVDQTMRNPHGWTPWFKNPCRGQWLLFWTESGGAASPSSETAVSAAPGQAGKAPGYISTGGPPALADAPACGPFAGSGHEVIQPKGRPDPCAGY